MAYTPTTFTKRTLARAESINAEFQAISNELAATADATEINEGRATYYTLGGGPTAYTLTASPAPTAYTEGMSYRVKVNATNGASPTLNLNSLGARAWKSALGASLSAGDLAVGSIIDVAYDGTDWRIVSTSVAISPGNTLATLAVLTPAADRMPYWTDASTAALATLTGFARTLLDDATQPEAQTTLGVVPGTNVQAYDADLAAIAALVSAADKVPYATGAGTWALADFTAAGRALAAGADAAAQRTTLELVKQTSTSDTTSGRVLVVGAFGLGGNAGAIGTALTNLTYSALFRLSASDVSTYGGPTGAVEGVLFVRAYGSTNTLQTFSEISGLQRTWTRRQVAGTWGPWVAQGLINRTTVSADVATVDMTFDRTAYKAVKVVIENLVPVANGDDLLLRLGNDAGSTFDAGAGDYNRCYIHSQSGAAPASLHGAQSYVTIGLGVANTSGFGISSIAYIQNANSSTLATTVTAQSGGRNSAAVNRTIGIFEGERATTVTHGSVRLLFSTGNISGNGATVSLVNGDLE